MLHSSFSGGYLIHPFGRRGSCKPCLIVWFPQKEFSFWRGLFQAPEEDALDLKQGRP